MPRVERARSGVVLELDAGEARLLRTMLEQLEDVLREGGNDKVTRRLFPDAYEDASDERAFRELVGDDLQTEKLARARLLREMLGRRGGALLELDDDRAEQALTVLTDLRLALGTRIGVDEELMAAELDASDPRAPALSVLHWLGWVQEEVVACLAQQA